MCPNRTGFACPSMRLSPGVQNSGSVPVRAAPRSRPTLNRLTFYLVMATLVLAVGTLLLAFFQGLSRLESGSLPGTLGNPSARLELATVPIRSSPAVEALGAEVREAFLRLPALPPSCS